MDKIMIRFNLIWFLALVLVIDLKAENIITENVVIETDRDIYIAGEDVYFSVFIDSRQRNKETSNVCYIVLRNERNTILRYYVKKVNNGTQSSFYLPDTLKTGYYELVAFTNYMRNFGEVTYSRKQLIVVNRFDEWFTGLKHVNTYESNSPALGINPEVIMLNTGKDSFGIRENVNLEIVSKQPLKNISITVKELNTYSHSLLKHPSITPLINNQSELKYNRETNGVHMYGKLLNGNIPVENECLYVTTPDTFPNLQYTFTNKEGEFSFILSDYYAGKPVIITTRENYQGKYRITIDDKFELSTPFVPDKKSFDATLRQYIIESQKIVKVRKAYNINHSKKVIHPDTSRNIPFVYHEPTKVVFPSQFVTLNNFEEIVNNLLAGFRIKPINELIHGYNLNPATGFLFENPSTIFLNGVYIYSLNKVMNFTTPDISKIELCNDNRLKGRIQFQGIISINTPKVINYEEVLPGSLITRLDNELATISYASPQYPAYSTKDPLPDFRQTLYWNTISELKEKEAFNFYTSDWSSDYIVEVKATTPNGNRIVSYKIINILGQ